MEYSLVCPFLTDDPLYAYGAEFGMLYARMQEACIGDKFSEYVTTYNQEQVTLLANRIGWTIDSMEPWGDDWVFIRMTKG